MRKTRIFLFLAILLCSSKVFAYDFAVLNSDNKEIYYTNLGGATVAVVYKSTTQYYSGDIVIPSSIRVSNTTYQVTRIGAGAFQNCTSLTSITLPSSVTSIGESAFNGCTSTSFTSITLPSSVTSIGKSAFLGCTYLTSITLSSSVTSIGADAFTGCSNLTTVNSLVENPTSVVSSSSAPFPRTTILNIPFGTRSDYINADEYNWGVTTVQERAVITVTSAGFATYCSTGNINFTNSGLDAYIATSYDTQNAKLTVTKCYIIPAGQGMLVNGTENTYALAQYKSSVASVTNKFKGTNVAMTLYQTRDGYTNYILGVDADNKAGFYKVAETSGGTLAAHKAYLSLENASGSSKKLVMEFKNENGQTTDIKTVELDGNLENIIYNLQGQKVQKPEHGVYIIKGKKTYIK